MDGQEQAVHEKQNDHGHRQADAHPLHETDLHAEPVTGHTSEGRIGGSPTNVAIPPVLAP